MMDKPARTKGIGERFAELVRTLADEEGDAAIAVLFDVTVTTIANWGKGTKLPQKDLEDVAARCAVTGEELRADDEVWQAVLERVVAQPHVIPRPPWLQLDYAIATRTRAPGVIILTADPGHITQRRGGGLDIVRNNIRRGLHYFYVVPEGGEHQRSLTRFIDELRALASKEGVSGTARIITTARSRKTIRQWKLIDHVMLFASGDGLADVDNLHDLAGLTVEEGYELLYKPGDEPHDSHGWKTLSYRQINYYKELFEEWGVTGPDEPPLTAAGLKLIGGPPEGRRWLRENIADAELVYNILYRTEEGANALSKPFFDEIPEIMATCMERGCTWVDLGLYGQNRFIHSTYNALSPKHRTAYSAAVLPADIPVLQITCVNFRDSRAAVLLGWTFPGSSSPRVFLGADAGITNYFKSYFHSLWDRATRIYEYGGPPKGDD